MIVDGWHYRLSAVLVSLMILLAAANLSMEISKTWKKQHRRKCKEHKGKAVFLRVPLD